MKSINHVIILLLSISSYAQTQKEYVLDTQQSIINWTGSYSFLMSEHKGTVQFKSGTLNTKNGSITGGNFTIDMTTISNPEYAENGNGPITHLKNEDFFNVTKFPEAKLNILSVTYYEENDQHKFIANLTIKGITKEIEFWGNANSELMQLKTLFKIDRIRWGITHNNDLRDHAISDAIEFDVTLYF